MRRIAAVLFVMLIAALLPATAGTILTLESRDAAGEDVARSAIYLRGDLLRLDDADVFGRRTSLVYDGTTLIVIDHVGEQYARLDEGVLQALRPRVVPGVGSGSLQSTAALRPDDPIEPDNELAIADETGFIARLNSRELVADESDEVARLRRLARTSHVFTPSAPRDKNPLRVVAGKSASHGAYECTWHKVYAGPRKVSSLCAATLESLGDAASARSKLERLSDFMTMMSATFGRGPLSESDRSPVGLFRETGGIPVFMEHSGPDRKGWATSLTAVEALELTDAMFAAPDGYLEIDLLDPQR